MLSLANLAEITLQEIIQEGAYRRDGGDTADRVPTGAGRGLDNVGGELESEAGDKPAREAQPYVAPFMSVG